MFDSKFYKIQGEMLKEIITFLPTLKYFKERTGVDDLIDITIEDFEVSVSSSIVEDEDIYFHITYFDDEDGYNDEEEEVHNWHSLIEDLMNNPERGSFYKIIKTHREKMKDCLIADGVEDEHQLERYVNIRNISDLTLGYIAINNYHENLLKIALANGNVNSSEKI